MQGILTWPLQEPPMTPALGLHVSDGAGAGADRSAPAFPSGCRSARRVLPKKVDLNLCCRVDPASWVCLPWLSSVSELAIAPPAR